MRALESPGLMHVFVRVVVGGTLGTSSASRRKAGALLNSLMIKGVISKQQLHSGYVSMGFKLTEMTFIHFSSLSSCLESTSDFITDIPDLCDSLSEQLGPLMLSRQLTLHSLLIILDSAEVSQKERVFAKYVYNYWNGLPIPFLDF